MRVELVMGERKAYPSDLTDEQWAVVGPFLDAWKAKLWLQPAGLPGHTFTDATTVAVADPVNAVA